MVLPEGAPSNVALTEVLVTGGLLYQQLDLTINIKGLLMSEVIASQLQFHSLSDGYCPLVQLLRMVALRLLPWRGRGRWVGRVGSWVTHCLHWQREEIPQQQ